MLANKDPNKIDFAIGEPKLITNIYKNILWLRHGEIRSAFDDVSYPHPQGYKKLVDYLSNKHNKPVIITNGAKQALGAIFYSLKKRNINNLAARNPYWSLIKPLAEFHGLKFLPKNVPDTEYESYLCISPNNPDNYTVSDIQNLYEEHKENNIPFIHDAVYNHYEFLGRDPTSAGDLVCYSFSKKYGYPNLRLGYIVVNDESYMDGLLEYQEMMTVGVSHLPQEFVYQAEQLLHDKQYNFSGVQQKVYDALKLNRDTFEKAMNVKSRNPIGMFGWYQLDKSIFEQKDIVVLDGKGFGKEGFVRVNLAIEHDKLLKIVEKLNE